MAEEGKSRLGRGLAALIGEVGEEMGTLERKGFTPKSVPVEFLRANPRNPRKVFDDTDLSELTQSIKDRGIIQPIVVRPVTNSTDQYEIVAGERRWRAAQKAGLHRVPVVVVHIDDKTSLEYAILENVQRADLNPIEEAEGYSRLMAEFSYTQENLSKIIGKSRSHIANTLRLTELPVQVRKLLIDRQITAGHGRALLSVNDPVVVAKRILDEGMSVRQVEEIAQADSGGSSKAAAKAAKPSPVEKDPDTRALEKALQDVLGLTVSIDHKGQGGELRIKYKTLDQLDGLCRRLNP
ncbi:ParB family chromosome partitioning protein [Microvirga lupini]|uniref:ParB family chromosome partitioning protein n=1 Tax=Microvirga lupini TaxID=420324 RepID=A0A7W4VPL2_9HYPH|nr:ParB/RepB/Spo0J family partition protein [Microvirga lupini]MBB3020994.1 ParB family chromosome partitioning protein [Microvirga lupini]